MRHWACGEPFSALSGKVCHSTIPMKFKLQPRSTARVQFTASQNTLAYTYPQPELARHHGELKYRPRGAEHQRWHTLTGDARGVRFKEIAEKARTLLAALRLQGIDPRAELERPAGLTFETLFNNWLERRAKLRKRSWREDEERHKLHIAKRMGSRLVFDIARRDVILILNDIADTVSPITANRCLSIISVVFSWAVAVEMVESHPAMRIPKPGVETVRERVLSHPEISALWNALAEIEEGRREGMTPRLDRLLKVLMLTGQRKGEVSNMPVAEVTGDAWVIPSERMKAKRQHLIPLAPLALATINAAMA